MLLIFTFLIEHVLQSNLKYEEEKLRETEDRLRQLEIDRQQELQRQLIKEQSIQREKEEELRIRLIDEGDFVIFQ